MIQYHLLNILWTLQTEFLKNKLFIVFLPSTPQHIYILHTSWNSSLILLFITMSLYPKFGNLRFIFVWSFTQIITSMLVIITPIFVHSSLSLITLPLTYFNSPSFPKQIPLNSPNFHDLSIFMVWYITHAIPRVICLK